MAGRPPAGGLAFAALLAAVLASPEPAGAQDVICCNQLIQIGGDWIGASRNCAGTLELATPAQRQIVCDAFAPPAAMCPDAAPYCGGGGGPCDGSEPSKLDPGDDDLLGPDDPFVQGLVDGLADLGVADVGAEHVFAQDRPRAGRIQFTVRLDLEGCLLPTGSCVLWAGSQGLIPEGSQTPARRLLFGSVEVHGRKVRVRARIVDVETGVVLDAAKGTVKGEPPLAVANAFAEALSQLDMACLVANGLVL
jgi:hypothetical protein